MFINTSYHVGCTLSHCYENTIRTWLADARVSGMKLYCEIEIRKVMKRCNEKILCREKKITEMNKDRKLEEGRAKKSKRKKVKVMATWGTGESSRID